MDRVEDFVHPLSQKKRPTRSVLLWVPVRFQVEADLTPIVAHVCSGLRMLVLRDVGRENIRTLREDDGNAQEAELRIWMTAISILFLPNSLDGNQAPSV